MHAAKPAMTVPPGAGRRIVDCPDSATGNKLVHLARKTATIMPTRCTKAEPDMQLKAMQPAPRTRGYREDRQ